MKEEFYELLLNILDDIRYTVKHGTYSINDGKLEKNVNTNNNTVAVAEGVALNFCPNCGTKTNGSNFCSNCGAKLK